MFVSPRTEEQRLWRGRSSSYPLLQSVYAAAMKHMIKLMIRSGVIPE